MSRSKGHDAYDERMFTQLGVKRWFYKSFVVPGIRRIKGNKCEECSSTDKLQVHHTSLELINKDTLKLLCFDCHKKIPKGTYVQGDVNRT